MRDTNTSPNGLVGTSPAAANLSIRMLAFTLGWFSLVLRGGIFAIKASPPLLIALDCLTLDVPTLDNDPMWTVMVMMKGDRMSNSDI